MTHEEILEVKAREMYMRTIIMYDIQPDDERLEQLWKICQAKAKAVLN